MRIVRSRLMLFTLIGIPIFLLISKTFRKQQREYNGMEPISDFPNEVSNPLEVTTEVTTIFGVTTERITVVTAYFDLGTFLKGSSGEKFSKPMYFRWADVFRFMTNPLVVYTDAPDFYEMMTRLRRGRETSTKIFLIHKNSSWAFQNEARVKEIISSPGYPEHQPNTVVSGYSCSQHAKYDVIARVARADFFKTKFISWVDIGYFRDRKSDRSFELVKPKNFNESCVMMNQVRLGSKRKKPEEIFLKNRVWVGGGLVLGERETLIQFAGLFRRAVEFYLSKGLVNTDQQVLYAIYSQIGRQDVKPEVEIQLYRSLDWFGLGYEMLSENIEDRIYTSQGLKRQVTSFA